MSLPTARVQETQAIMPHRKFEGHLGEIKDILCLQGGQRIMTCHIDGPLRVWDVDRGTQIGEDWGDEAAEMYTFALSPDGKKIVGGSTDGTTRVWKIDTAKVIAKWMGHRLSVTFLYWNRDGRKVVSSNFNDIEVRVWDAETGDAILGPLKSGCGGGAIYSPDETMIAAGGSSRDNIGRIDIWDANTGKPVTNLIEGRVMAVTSMAWPGHGKTLIAGLNDGKIVTWNTTTWQRIAVLKGHTGVVFNFAISLNDLILASVGDGDRTARLWDLENGQPIGSPLQHAKNVRCLSFSPNGKELATGCTDGNAYTWDVSAIVREAGREKLLSTGNLRIDAPRRPIGHPALGLAEQRRNRALNNERLDRSRPQATYSASPRGGAEHPSPSRFHGVRSWFNRTIHQWTRNVPVVDVPLAPATYGDYVAGEEDGRRPYVLFFCLRWFQRREREPEPIPQVYDVDLVNAEQDDLDVPIPMSREDIKLKSMADQPQAVAGPSRLPKTEGHPVAQPS